MDKAQTILNFSAEIDLEDSLDEVISWMKEHQRIDEKSIDS